jgi:hypothetical protein
MIEDMTVRGFTEKMRQDYVRHVHAFAAFIGRSPDTATAEELRLFQLHQTRSGMQPPSINGAVSAVRFFFTVTPDAATDHRPPCPCRGGRMMIVAVFGRGGAPRGPPSGAGIRA